MFVAKSATVTVRRGILMNADNRDRGSSAEIEWANDVTPQYIVFLISRFTVCHLCLLDCQL